jgi:malate dehydrogenase (oxaloacetate-decarboxylating)
MRLHAAPDHGVVGAVATAIADQGGIVMAVDVAESGPTRLVLDITCSAVDAKNAGQAAGRDRQDAGTVRRRVLAMDAA